MEKIEELSNSTRNVCLHLARQKIAGLVGLNLAVINMDDRVHDAEHRLKQAKKDLEDKTKEYEQEFNTFKELFILSGMNIPFTFPAFTDRFPYNPINNGQKNAYHRIAMRFCIEATDQQGE